MPTLTMADTATIQEEFDKALEGLDPRRPIVFMPNDSQSTSFKYVTHAHTLEELRQEYLSDVKRRLDNLDAQKRFVAGSATKLAQIAYAVRELEDLARFWQQVELRNARKKRGQKQEV